MKCVLLLIVLLFAPVSEGQNSSKRIGEIEFFGYAGLDLNRVRAAMPLHEGDPFTTSDDRFFETIDRIKKEIKRVTGHSLTDVAAVCCDTQGNYMIYIGLLGNSIRTTRYNPVPKGKLKLPSRIVNLYRQSVEANSVLVQKGVASEDDSKGYALSNDLDLRAKQLAIRAYALKHERLLRRVLRSFADAEQRTVAAHSLGYARQSRAQIADLVWASHDVDEGVRNDAIRALGVLAQSSPKVAGQISPEGLIDMISSGSWTDRNKAGFLLDELSKQRDPKLLRELSSRSLDSLIEMARWRSRGHADFARILLGRIAGIEETRLQQLVAAERVDQIIYSVQRKT
jgi:hypothetical protein